MWAHSLKRTCLWTVITTYPWIQLLAIFKGSANPIPFIKHLVHYCLSWSPGGRRCVRHHCCSQGIRSLTGTRTQREPNRAERRVYIDSMNRVLRMHGGRLLAAVSVRDYQCFQTWQPWHRGGVCLAFTQSQKRTTRFEV